MNCAEVKEELIAVLRQVQNDSGLKCPTLTGVTKPVEDIPKFDSMIWPGCYHHPVYQYHVADTGRHEHLCRRRHQTTTLYR